MNDDREPPKRRSNGTYGPGFSGNRAGRPSKPKREKAWTSDEIVLREAARLIPVGDETLSTEELVIRATAAKAAKGDPRAQTLFLRHVTGARRRYEEQVKAVITGLLRLKDEGDAAITLARKRGKPEPYLFPHPNNIYFDAAQGCVWVYGGLTPEQAAAREGIRQRKRDIEEFVAELDRKIAENPDDEDALEARRMVKPARLQLLALDPDQVEYVGLLPRDQVTEPPRHDLILDVMRKAKRR